jgi:hypothetical protein
MISPSDLDLLKFTDDTADAMAHITEFAKRGGKAVRPPRHIRVLGEQSDRPNRDAVSLG